ncbi:uncharacterized protein PAC_05858 [Phialocephala subalpina]|uniref:Uncharacterized protein n=1 Tax=Phialocephala subalpina TaxID=576137 RepID=A0A1L7WT77_9HELO|nr:uncharacterized protein PAC_05858 [Phialocephala subalpina]
MATPVFRFTTELRETGYISETRLREKLVEVFGPGDYQISVSPQMCELEQGTRLITPTKTRSERWIYFAPRKLTPVELKTIMRTDAEP